MFSSSYSLVTTVRQAGGPSLTAAVSTLLAQLGVNRGAAEQLAEDLVVFSWARLCTGYRENFSVLLSL
eukprot:297920-Prymnesium_polylepis.2